MRPVEDIPWRNNAGYIVWGPEIVECNTMRRRSGPMKQLGQQFGVDQDVSQPVSHPRRDPLLQPPTIIRQLAV